MMLLCGWLLLDEIEYYSINNVFGIIGSSILIMIGIKIITAKTSVVTTLKRRNSLIPDESDPRNSNPWVNNSFDADASDTVSNVSMDVDSYISKDEDNWSGETTEDKKERMREAMTA